MSFSIFSDEVVTVTGWYKYDGHVNSGVFDCFVPQQSSKMFFKKGKTAPMLGSCEHKIKWKFEMAYK